MKFNVAKSMILLYVLDIVTKQSVPNFLLMVVSCTFVCKIKYLGVHLLSGWNVKLRWSLLNTYSLRAVSHWRECSQRVCLLAASDL